MSAAVFSLSFLGTRGSVAAARHWLEALLAPGAGGPQVPDEVAATAVLLLSEVATNAVQHSRSGLGGSYTVHARLTRAAVRVEVEDQGPVTARPIRAGAFDPDGESGRGLALVQAFAHHWGTLPGRCGVYFHLTWTPAPDDSPDQGFGDGVRPLPRRVPGRSHLHGDPFTWPIIRISGGGRASA